MEPLHGGNRIGSRHGGSNNAIERNKTGEIGYN
jgi:hypothetical protein